MYYNVTVCYRHDQEQVHLAESPEPRGKETISGTDLP
jgi:hypothetical protein